jgi:hypothetical protein
MSGIPINDVSTHRDEILLILVNGLPVGPRVWVRRGPNVLQYRKNSGGWGRQTLTSEIVSFEKREKHTKFYHIPARAPTEICWNYGAHLLYGPAWDSNVKVPGSIIRILTVYSCCNRPCEHSSAQWETGMVGRKKASQENLLASISFTMGCKCWAVNDWLCQNN